ncbi:MAG TPA: hypothetical protein PKD00_00195 [Burkholderiales bacterium]|nr:hypothetical protein [Burkholderiales bacterium]
MNTQEVNELSIHISMNLLVFLAEKGLLRHNQIYDTITEMDSNTVTKEYTNEFKAMIMGAAVVIKNTLTDKYEID